METRLKTLEPEHQEGQMMEMMIMKMTRMMTEEKAGIIRLLQTKEDRTREPQTMKGRKKRIVFLAY